MCVYGVISVQRTVYLTSGPSQRGRVGQLIPMAQGNGSAVRGVDVENARDKMEGNAANRGGWGAEQGVDFNSHALGQSD